MRKFKIWILFVVMVILASFTGFLITGFLTFLLVKFQLLQPFQPSIWLPFIGLFLASLIFSVITMLFLSHQKFKPIHQLIEALQNVATGDFSVRLPASDPDNMFYNINVNFNKMAQELSSMETLQSDFIQNVSHEFKTPLAAVEGYASLLNAASLPDDLHAYTGKILENTKQLSSLTGNILRLSKLENQQIVTDQKRYLLDEQLRQIILTMEPLWSVRDLNIGLNLPETWFYGNEDLMSQVWINLFSNAVKFTPDGGQISIQIVSSDAHIQVIFQDTGIGMDAETQKHIFDKFYQGDKSRKREGNGLGLALVKNILNLCQGTIYVTSEPGEGSCFTVVLHQPENGVA